MATVRAKCICVSVEKYPSNVWDEQHKEVADDNGFLYRYKFQAVYSGSPENDLFFGSTSGLSLELNAVRNDLYVKDQEYYLDFTPA